MWPPRPLRTRRQFLEAGALSVAGAAAARCVSAAGPSATAHGPAEHSDTVKLQRDAAGRLLAPVMIDDEGPFLFVVDTAATRCALSTHALKQLRLRPERTGELMVNGTTGRSVVSTVFIDHLQIGAFRLFDRTLPVLTADALGGAEGVLGADCLADRKLAIDFTANTLAVVDSLGPVIDTDTRAIEVSQQFGGIVCVDVNAGSIAARAIVDSGALHTLGNPELHKRLSEVTSTTLPISIAGMLLAQPKVEYQDHHVFRTWSFQRTPALILGLDVLARTRYMAIDYRRSELHIRV